MTPPSSNVLLSALAVFALGVFLNLLPFFAIPSVNTTVAVAVVSGLLGFIGGTANSQGRKNTASTESGDVNVTAEPAK